MTLGFALELIEEVTGIHFALVDGAVYFRVDPFPVERPSRAYPVGPVTEALDIHTEGLFDLIRTVVAPGSWEEDGVEWAIYEDGPWGGPALVIDQSAEIHGRIRDLLGRLRHRRQIPLPPVPEWRTELERALARELPIVSFLEETLQDVATFLAEEIGCPIVVDPELVALGDVPPITLRLRELPLREVLDLLARQARAVWRLHDEAILITDEDGPGPELFLQVYRPGAGEGRGTVEAVVDIFQEATRDAWENPGTHIDTLGGLLLVKQTREVHARLAEIVATFQRREEPAEAGILDGLERTELDLLLEELLERIREERHPGYEVFP